MENKMGDKMKNSENNDYETPNKKQKKFHENTSETIDYTNIFINDKNYVLEFIPKTLQITRQNASINANLNT